MVLGGIIRKKKMQDWLKALCNHLFEYFFKFYVGFKNDGVINNLLLPFTKPSTSLALDAFLQTSGYGQAIMPGLVGHCNYAQFPQTKSMVLPGL